MSVLLAACPVIRTHGCIGCIRPVPDPRLCGLSAQQIEPSAVWDSLQECHLPSWVRPPNNRSCFDANRCGNIETLGWFQFTFVLFLKTTSLMDLNKHWFWLNGVFSAGASLMGFLAMPYTSFIIHLLLTCHTRCYHCPLGLSYYVEFLMYMVPQPFPKLTELFNRAFLSLLK